MALAATPAAAVAANKVVYAGGPAKFQQTLGSKYGATLDNFLVNRVAIHVGDTVTWNGASLLRSLVDHVPKSRIDPGRSLFGQWPA